MNFWVESLNGLAVAWQVSILRACWQGGVALLIVWLICRTINRLPASAKAWLWRLAFAKFLIAFLWSTPIDVPLLPSVPPNRVAQMQNPAVFNGTHEIQVSLFRTASAPLSNGRQARVEPRLTRPAWLLIFWSLGVVACAAKIGLQFRRVRILHRNSTAITEPDLVRQAEEAASCLGLKRVPALATSQEIGAPILVGIIRPLVILPANLLDGIAGPSLRMIFAHEMAHVKRRDLVWALFCVVIERFFFFYPIIWCVRHEWRMTQEMACDELAICHANSKPAAYAGMLLDVACRTSPNPQALALSVVETKQTLKRRITAMKNIRSVSRASRLAICVAIALTASIAIVPWRLVAQSQTPPAKDAKPTDPEITKENPPQTDRDELSKLRAENERLREEIRNARSGRLSIFNPKELAVLDAENLAGKFPSLNIQKLVSSNVQEALARAAEVLQKKQTELTDLLSKYTSQHPLVQQKTLEIDKLESAQALISQQLEELNKLAGTLSLNNGSLNEFKKGRNAGKASTRSGEERALLLEEIELEEKQMEVAKKKLENGTGSPEESARAAHNLYTTRRELARLDGDSAQLRQIAEEEIRLVEQQLTQVNEQIKVGNVATGADIDLRRELLRLKRELLKLPKAPSNKE